MNENYLIKVIGKERASEIIEKREPRGIFILHDPFHKNPYIGIDNTTGDAWVEEFNDIRACFRWLYRRDLGEDLDTVILKKPIKSKIESAKGRQGSESAVSKTVKQAR